MKTIIVIGAEGSSAKTAVAVGLASALALEGYRVLLQDLDSEATATRLLGHRPSHPWRTPPAPIAVEDARGALAFRPGGRALIAATGRDVLSLLAMTPEPVDFLVADAPAPLDAGAVGALEAADVALIVLEPTASGLTVLQRVARSLYVLRPTVAPRSLRAVLLEPEGESPETLLELRGRVDSTYPGVLVRSQIRADVVPGAGARSIVASAAPLRELAREIAVGG